MNCPHGHAASGPKLAVAPSSTSPTLALPRACWERTPTPWPPPTHPATGPLLETFTVNEVARQLAALPTRRTLSHYRDHQGREIDLVLEARSGHVVAVEIKATSSPSLKHLDNLRWLRNKLDDANPGTFQSGILLHTGPHAATLDDRLHLRPISTLWSG